MFKHKKILFSKGNLQYHPLNNEWRFAESQLECMMEVPKDSLSVTYDGWIDLFCWGTGNCPTKVSTDIFSPDTAFVNFVDWGINQIGNDKPNTWRTLTNEEWHYLTDGKEGRKNADSLCSVAQIAGMNGFYYQKIIGLVQVMYHSNVGLLLGIVKKIMQSIK